jgi:hypothetical protein
MKLGIQETIYNLWINEINEIQKKRKESKIERKKEI